MCWFKATAKEHIARVYEIVYLLEEHKMLVRVFKCRRPGYIVYEDEHQVVAEPFAELRL